MGEAILVLLALGVAGYVLLAPGIALAVAARANARREELEARVRDLEQRLAERDFAAARPRFPAAEIVHRPGAQPWGPVAGSPHVVASDPARAAAVGGGAPGRTAAIDPARGADLAADPALARAGVNPAAAIAADPAAGAADLATARAAIPEAGAIARDPALGGAAALDAAAASAGDPAAGSAADPAASTADPAAAAAALAAASAGDPAAAGAAASAGAPASATAPAADPATAPAAAPASAAGQAPAAPPAASPRPPPRPAAPEAASPPASLEEHLGLTWLTRVGAAVFLLGALFFFKYAVDNAWIGPTGRVAVGGVVGVALLGAAEIIRSKTKPRFVHALTGIGIATLFVSIWAAAAFYQLIGPGLALGINTVILFVGAALALRYDGEPILLLTLVAGFLNPVILSTGQDRPLELFAYLLLITSACHAVAHRQRFRIVPALAVVGVAALFGGWYAKYFDIGDHRASTYDDLPPSMAFGPYLELSARAVPLAFVGLFAAEWSVFAVLRRARAAAEARALGIAALVLAHAGAALLLYDTPRLLAVVAIGLAVCSILLLRRLEAQSLLVIPMGAAFLAFLAVSGGVPEDQRTALVGMLGVWTLVYLAGFLRGKGRLGAVPAAAAISSAVGAALFDALAGVLLIGSRASTFVFILALSSGIVAFLASRSGRPAIRVLALFASLGAVLLTAILRSDAATPAVDPVFLTATAVWSVVYLVAVIEDVLRRGAKVSWDIAITVSLATLGFLAAALLGTSQDTPALRAILTAGTGLADLAVGALLLRPAGEDREPVVLLLAQALGLFAAAIAFALSGASVTVLWAALAVVAAAIAARTLDRLWLGVAAMLFLAAIFRLLAFDAAGVQATVDQFFSSYGRAGAMTVPVLWNPRAYALAGVGVALLFAAYLLSRAPRVPFRNMAALAATLGYGLLLALAITEVRSAVFHPPPAPPYPLDGLEWSAFMNQYDAAAHAQRGWMAMGTTLVMAVFAAALLVAGFAVRDAFHRYLGLALFTITVAKLAAWDVWNIERIYQIILLTGVGALLVSGGFLYARFGKRLVLLMREGSPTPDKPKPGDGPSAKGAAALIFLAILAGGARAEAADARGPLPVSAFPVMRAIQGVNRAGDHFFTIDADTYRASHADALLGDLRIAGPDGAEVPYVIREVASLRSPYKQESITATMLDPSYGSGGAVYATFRLSPRADHCRVDLDLSGDTFLRRARIETGEDPRELGTVIEGPYVYRVRQGGSQVEELSIPYPLSQASLVRVTLLSESGGSNVRIRGARFSCPTQRDLELDRPVDLYPLKIEESTRDAAAKTTVLTLDAGVDGLPIDALVVDVGTEEWSRRVDVTATSYREVWPEAGQGAIYRIKGRGGALELRRIPILETRKRWLKLTIHDEDSAPLAITAVRGEVRRREITFRAAQGGAHTLYAGDRMRSRPAYDLEEILARGDHGDPQRSVELGPVVPNPRFGVEDRPPNLPVTERYRTAIGVGLAIVLLALSIWAIGLMRRAPSPSTSAEEKKGEERR